MVVVRFAVVASVFIATFVARDKDSTVLSLVSYAWAGFGAAFGPALIMSLYWKRMNTACALAGIVIGGVTVVIWKQLSGGWFDLYEIIPGVLFAFIAIVVATLATAPPVRSVTERFESVEAEIKG